MPRTISPDGASPITVTQLLQWYDAAIGTSSNTLTAEQVIAQAPTALQPFLAGLAETHAVHAPGP